MKNVSLNSHESFSILLLLFSLQSPDYKCSILSNRCFEALRVKTAHEASVFSIDVQKLYE